MNEWPHKKRNNKRKELNVPHNGENLNAFLSKALGTSKKT